MAGRRTPKTNTKTKMNQEITKFEIVPESVGIEPEAKLTIETAFTGYFAQARAITEKVSEIEDPTEARIARLELKAIRVAGNKTHKTLKEDSLRMGRAIDGTKNILLALVVPAEKQLEEIEKKAEREAAEALEVIRQDRKAQLDKIGHDPLGIDLANLSEGQWTEYFQQANDAYQARVEREKKSAAEEAARQAAELAARDAERKENLRLKAEAEKREAEIKAEREKAEAEKRKLEEEAAAAKKAAEEELAKERAKIEAEAAKQRKKDEAEKAKAAAKQAKAEAEAKALRDAAKAKEKAEAAKARTEAAAAKKAAAAPDKAKLMAFAETIRSLTIPAMKSEEGIAVASNITSKNLNYATWVEAQAEKL